MGIEKAQDGHGTHSPFFNWLGDLLDSNSEASQVLLDEHSSCETAGGTEAAVEGRGMATPSLVAEEMGDWCECSFVGALLLSLLELLLDEVCHQLFSLDLR